MKKKPSSSDSQKIDRTYRRQIAMDAKLDGTIKLLADHLTRVLRQNDTLRQALGRQEIVKLASANKFMGEKLS